MVAEANYFWPALQAEPTICGRLRFILSTQAATADDALREGMGMMTKVLNKLGWVLQAPG